MNYQLQKQKDKRFFKKEDRNMKKAIRVKESYTNQSIIKRIKNL